MTANYWTGLFYHQIASTLITTFGIPFAYVDLLAASVYPFPMNIFWLFTAKTLGSINCYIIANWWMGPERKKIFL
jgi:hypothetical protein